MNWERTIKSAGFAVSTVAAIGTVIVDGEPELAMFMAATVISALVVFDVSFDRNANAFWTWILVTGAVLGAAVPRTISRLFDEPAGAGIRPIHLSSVLFGLCLATAAATLARPPKGVAHRGRITAILALAPTIGGVAAATAAYVGQTGLSTRASRILETLGWASAAAIVVAVLLATAAPVRPPAGLALFAIGLLYSATVVAGTAAGQINDLGWLAVAIVLVSAPAFIFLPPTLGRDTERRMSVVPTIIAVIGAVVAAQVAILGANVDDAWKPGTLILAALALAMLAVGVPMYRSRSTAVVDESPAATAVFEMIVDNAMELTDHTGQWSVPIDPWPDLSASTEATERPSRSAFQHALGFSSEDDPARSGRSGPTEPSVRRARDVPPHLIDPTTGLASAAGLQRALTDAFAQPPDEREVSILVVALKSLDRVEHEHGRVVAAQVIAELASRFRLPLPDACVARFSTQAFAALIDQQVADVQQLTERFTAVLVDLLDPVQVGDLVIEIDVAAGMAQCYQGEDVSGFVSRANEGLKRAIVAGEPTLIAMP